MEPQQFPLEKSYIISTRRHGDAEPQRDNIAIKNSPRPSVSATPRCFFYEILVFNYLIHRSL